MLLLEMIATSVPTDVAKTRCNHMGPKGGACPTWAIAGASTCAKHAMAPTGGLYRQRLEPGEGG